MNTPIDIAAALGRSEEDVETLRDDILAALRTVYDPDIHVNILDLGLVYAIDIDANANVHIDMTLTAPACPVAGTFPQVVKEAVEAVEGVNACEVDLVWEPPWSVDCMSDEIKLELGLL